MGLSFAFRLFSFFHFFPKAEFSFFRPCCLFSDMYFCDFIDSFGLGDFGSNHQSQNSPPAHTASKVFYSPLNSLNILRLLLVALGYQSSPESFN